MSRKSVAIYSQRDEILRRVRAIKEGKRAIEKERNQSTQEKEEEELQ